jgi:hypothetical protein
MPLLYTTFSTCQENTKPDRRGVFLEMRRKISGNLGESDGLARSWVSYKKTMHKSHLLKIYDIRVKISLSFLI